MKKVSHYQLENSIGVSGPYIFYSALDINTQHHYIVKAVTEKEGLGDSAQLQHEYYLINRLRQYDHFPKIHEYNELIPGIVFVDEQLERLSTLCANKKISVETFLPLAIVLARAVAEMHQEQIIHKNLTPHAILYNEPSGQLQITDFSIASELMRTMVPSDPPRLLQGHLAYMSPEQTGRMNRPLTSRSDLYSLGIIFYELLIGHVPFDTREPMLAIINHINTVPPAPHEIDKNIPQLLSNIVMKLLEKEAEARYKSALGLADDLELAWIEYKDKQSMSNFQLGKKDVATQLQLSEKLYGREKETELLQNYLEEILTTKSKGLLSISGYSGIGKSSLVNELLKKITLSQSYFISGKFDKFQQSDSYHALREALNALVQYQFNLTEKEFLNFKKAVIDELGAILKIIIEFVPNLKNMMGELPDLPNVGIEETKNRFHLAMQRFFKAITREHALVLFLDDLQWANSSTIELLEKILLSKDINNLLLIVSYRSNEVGEAHPLTPFLKNMADNTYFKELKIEGLSEVSTDEMLQDMLSLPKHEVSSLATILSKKTEGNPFFMLMVLEELYKEELLYFSKERARWVWKEEDIISVSASENIIAFVDRRLSKLSEETKNILHSAACIGGTFSIEALCSAKLGDAPFLIESLKPAVKAALIIPLNLSDEWSEGVSSELLLKRQYRFQHDRIQQSAYQLKSLEETKQIQLELARNWYQAHAADMTDKQLLMIVDQYNNGLSYISNSEEKQMVAMLNHDASKVALYSIAYELAYQYASVAKSLSSEEEWISKYTFIYDVCLNYIKCAFLTYHYDESNAASEIALKKAKTKLDKARVLLLKGNLERAIGKKIDIDNNYFVQGLQILGYKRVAKKPNLLDVLKSTLQFQFKLHYRYQKIQDITVPTSEEQSLIEVLSLRLCEENYYAGNIIRYAYCLMTWAVLTYHQQSKALRGLVYGAYNIIWPFSQFSYRIYSENYATICNETSTEQVATYMFPVTVLHMSWHRPWHEVSKNLEQAATLCERAGSLEFLGYSLMYKSFYKLEPCSDVLHYLETLNKTIADISPRISILLKVCCQYYSILTDSYSNIAWQEDLFDEESIEKTCRESKYIIALNLLHSYSALCFVHFNRAERFGSDLSWVKRNISSIVDAHNPYDITRTLFSTIIMLVDSYSRMTLKNKIVYSLFFTKICRHLKRWSKMCPENFAPFYQFSQAEKARLKGNISKAIQYYDEAIESANNIGLLEYAALMSQRALTLCLQNYRTALVPRYLKQALRYYEKWQASAVVEYLKETYGEWLSKE